MNLDELRSLDPKDMGSWPIPVQIVLLMVVFLAILVGGYFYVWSGQLEELDTGRAQEEQLKTQFLEKKAKAINLEAYRQQLLEIQQAFGAMLKQLPNRSEMETLLTEINQAGVSSGLQFELFRPGAEVKTNEFAEMPISIKISGNFQDLAAFISNVAQLSRIVTVNDVRLSPAGGAQANPTGALTLEATVKTYRALDDSEAQALRQAELDAKKKNKK